MRPSFPRSELDYDLPAELIAQEPLPDRGASRLLIVDRQTRSLVDARFADLPLYLRSGDLLVLNNTRVVPAKFRVRRRTGGRLDGLFLEECSPGTWEVLLNGARRVRPGETLTVEPASAGVDMLAEARLGEGRWRVGVAPVEPAVELLERVGQTPLPPYIARPAEPHGAAAASDRSRYQTVFAERPGAVAAPTAGLHFTEAMLATLRDGGVETGMVTLRVGLGTFAPIKANDLADHAMHAEWYDLPAGAADAVARCRLRGGRVVCVGTTSLRVLESNATEERRVKPGTGWTELFCYPPYEFRVAAALLTNYHLPGSTLLALVMAYAGVELTRAAYRHAIEAEYRFFSYGDAMLIV